MRAGCLYPGLQKATAASIEDNKRVVANFVEVCQNQHDLAAADEIFHPASRGTNA